VEAGDERCNVTVSRIRTVDVYLQSVVLVLTCWHVAGNPFMLWRSFLSWQVMSVGAWAVGNHTITDDCPPGRPQCGCNCWGGTVGMT
jgi:hypothetical protein